VRGLHLHVKVLVFVSKCYKYVLRTRLKLSVLIAGSGFFKIRSRKEDCG